MTGSPDTDEYFFDEGCFIVEISNSPSDPLLSIARARVPPGVTTRWHRLKGIEERYLVLEGSGSVEVGGAPPRGVGEGDLIRIPAGCRQRITNTGKSDLIFLALCTPRFQRAAYQDLEGGG